MNPLAKTRYQMNITPTQVNSNPGNMGNNQGVDGAEFKFFDQEQEFNGEVFAAGDMLLGDNTIGNLNTNLVWFQSQGVWQFRFEQTMIVQIDSGLRSKVVGYEPLAVSVAAGDNDISLLDADSHMYSYVRITAAGGNFNVNSILNGRSSGQLLILHNDTTADITLKNNFYGGAPPTGFTSLYTLTGADITITGYGIAQLIYTETTSAATAQWFLMNYTG